MDESNLTGESELAVRGAGDPVWSGSFAVEGTALFEAAAVGGDTRVSVRSLQQLRAYGSSVADEPE